MIKSKERQETEASLAKSGRVCRYICTAMKVIAVLFCIFWLLAVGAMVCSLMNPDRPVSNGGVSVVHVLLYLAHGVIIATLLFNLIGIFSDVGKGESPFSMAQVKRLRLIAGLLLLYAILDNIINQNNALLNFSGLDSGYVTPSGNTIIQINFAPFVVSAVVFAFSFVFKYGVLLQEFSDEAI